MVARLASPRHFLMSPELTRPDWLKMRQRNSKFLWLDKNENTDPTLRRLIDQLVGELDSSVYSIYPDNGVLYRKLGEHLNVLPEQVILTPGSDGAIRSLFEAYVAPEDVVIHVQPTFAMYTVYCQIYGAKPVVMDYQPSTIGPILDVDAFVCAIKTHQPKLVCLANPGSPTGTVLPANELRRIIEATADVSGIMLVDEAYYPFYSKTVVGWLSEYKHLVVARSFAKAWGLAGFRVGCAIGSSDVIGILHKIRPMYEVNTLAICMLEKMLDYYDEVLQSVKRLEKGKQYFLDAMEQLGLQTLRGYGNFLHVAFGVYAHAVHTVLADKVLYRLEFNDPCLKGFSRFTTTTEELFKPIVDVISKVVNTVNAKEVLTDA